MKIIITGSLGNVSKPLAIDLVRRGHQVTVVSSNTDKQKKIESLGAKAAIGKMEDIQFLTATFMEADAVYCMIPLNFTEADLPAYLLKIAKNYLQALMQARVQKVVVLSGWSADMVSGEKLEAVFAGLTDAYVTYLRPASFYSNFYNSVDMIKGKGFIGKFLTLRYSGLWALLTGKTGLLLGNAGGDDRTVFVSPLDIADAASEELLSNATGKTKIRYVGSDEMTYNEAAKIIGTAVGKPWLKWVLISDEQMLQGLKMAKMPQKTAEMLVEMQAAMHSGAPLKKYHENNPKPGTRKLKDFAKEFALVYNQKA